MALCHTRLKTIPGIARPAIALFLPTKHGPRILLDAGANADCKPEYLVQFGLMGSIYAEFALGMKAPRVGLLSIGTEAHKGNELTQAAMPLMGKAPINFIGNVEGDQIFTDDDVDVIVCDGFVGNVVLKVAEGVAGTLVDTLRTGIKRSAWARMGVLFMRGPFRRCGIFSTTAHTAGRSCWVSTASASSATVSLTPSPSKTPCLLRSAR